MTESFKQKMQQYAPEPPQQAWEAIEARLDDQPRFASKLHDFEVQPPAQVWQNLVATLDQPVAQPAPIRKIHWSRYAAAAVLLLVFYMGYYFLGQRQVAPAAPVAAGSLFTTTPGTTPKAPNSNQTPTGNTFQNETLAVSAAVNNTATKAASAAQAKLYLRKVQRAAVETPRSFAAFIPSYAESRTNMAFDGNERYMVYSDGEGNAVRLPRHLFDYVACITNELDCKKRMEQLRSKAAAVTMNTDFTGLLELLSGLSENQ